MHHLHKTTSTGLALFPAPAAAFSAQLLVDQFHVIHTELGNSIRTSHRSPFNSSPTLQTKYHFQLFYDSKTGENCIEFLFKGISVSAKALQELRELQKQYHFRINLKEAIFEGDFFGADFRGMDLTGADFRKASLPFAQFQEAKLSFCNFSGTNVGFANFTGAELHQAILYGTHFYGAELPDVNFRSTHLAHPTTKANFEHANLSAADFSYRRINRFHFDNATMVETKFEGSLLEGAHFTRANLSQADFLDARLVGADFTSAQLTGAKLHDSPASEAHFNGSILDYTDLAGTTLSGATFDRKTSFKGTIIFKTIFENIVGEIDPLLWNISLPTFSATSNPDNIRNWLHLHFDHLSNNESGSLLKNIYDMPESMRELKLHHFRQCISLLKSAPCLPHLPTIASAVLDIFQHYLGDETIRQFCMDHLAPIIMTGLESNPQPPRPAEVKLLQGVILARFEELDARLGRTTNSIRNKRDELEFIQYEAFLVNCILQDEPDSPASQQLSEKWFALVKRHVTLDTIDHEAMTDYRIFMSPDRDRDRNLLLIDSTEFNYLIGLEPLKHPTTFSCFIYDDESKKWRPNEYRHDTLALFPEVDTLVQAKVTTLVGISLMTNYFTRSLPQKPAVISQTFHDALSIENRVTTFGTPARPNERVHPDTPAVIEALGEWINRMGHPDQIGRLSEAKSATVNVAPSSSQYDMRHELLHCLTQEFRLTDDALKQIIDAFKELPTRSPDTQAVLFLCLAHNFLYLNSKHMFGSEMDSPLPLRLMGLGLLNRAFELIQTLSPSHPLKIQIEPLESEFHRKIMGVRGELDCTALISERLLLLLNAVEGETKNRTFTHIKNSVIPPLWRRI